MNTRAERRRANQETDLEEIQANMDDTQDEYYRRRRLHEMQEQGCPPEFIEEETGVFEDEDC